MFVFGGVFDIIHSMNIGNMVLPQGVVPLAVADSFLVMWCLFPKTNEPTCLLFSRFISFQARLCVEPDER